MRVLITGINGFIGSYLAEYLLNKQLEVHGIVRRMEHLENISHLKNKITLRKCDVRDSVAVKNVMKKSKPDLLFHLAAQSYPTVSWKDPIGTMETNVIGTINVFEAILELKMNPRTLVACSSAEYGFVQEKEVPIKENHPLRPVHPYGVSKVAQDLLAYQYFKNFGLNVIRVRIFGTTGPRKVNDVCSDFAMQIAEIERGARKPVMYVGNLDSKRDLTDVRDMIKALWLLMERGKAGEVYNACSGKAYRIRDILNKFLEMSGADVEVKIDPKKLRPTDEPIIVGDNSKIRKDCGWKPEIPIAKTLKDTLEYWREKCGMKYQ
jgi:GDP-4-dehydro-6-deoxy-D-mannose reductase